MLTVDFQKLEIKPGSRILDAGCGGGRHLCEAFRSQDADVVGIDLNWEDLCKAKYNLNSINNGNDGLRTVSMADVTTLPFKTGIFDMVICSEVLEHIPENRTAIAELVRVLKPGKNLVISVPRFLPERICWAISESYRNEPGGHIRIYRKKELRRLLENAGTRCWSIRYKHALHAPYWWLKCLVGPKNENSRLVNWYKWFLERDIIKPSPLTRALDKMLIPFIAKSIVFYLKKGI
ncbi:MAG: class I SAM-dependent methyltransferase [Deltaproteobacteria bacterium]|nr:MAG: class I SAM-dependent methyltransferase [Deltaproteobacteria bacterium]